MNLKNALGNIKKFYSNNKSTIEIILIVVCLLIIFISIKSCRENKISSDRLKIANDSLNMKIKEVIDENGKTHAQIRQLELTNKELNTINTNLSEYYKKKLDSISGILKIKSKQIIEYLSIIQTVKGEGKTIIETVYSEKDKIKDTSYKFEARDYHLDFSGYFNTKSSYLMYSYSYTDSLILTNFYKRKGLFGYRKEYYWDAAFSNPNAKISGMEQFKRDQNGYKRWSVTLGTSYGVDSKVRFVWVPLTLTVGYKLFEF